MIRVEAIETIQMRKSGINHWDRTKLTIYRDHSTRTILQ